MSDDFKKCVVHSVYYSRKASTMFFQSIFVDEFSVVVVVVFVLPRGDAAVVFCLLFVQPLFHDIISLQIQHTEAKNIQNIAREDTEKSASISGNRKRASKTKNEQKADQTEIN